MIISRSVLRKIRNVSDESCRKNQNTHFVFNIPPPKVVLVVTMWKNIVEPDKPQMTIWRLRFVYWRLKATNTHSEYVIATAFPLLQRLHERVSVLRYTYIACLVLISAGR
jgi:hypothetical protein